MTGAPLGLALTYVGAVVGAGFASGREILQFFAAFGEKGLWGLLVAGAFFSMLGGAVLWLVQREQVADYRQLLVLVCGPKPGRMAEALTTAFLFGGLCVMMSGLGTLLGRQFGVAFELGLGLAGFAVLIPLLGDVRGIMWVNSVLMSFLALLLTAMFVTELPAGVLQAWRDVPVSAAGNWGFSGLLYFSYNSLIALVILSSLGPALQGRRAVCEGMIGGVLLAGLAAMITLLLFKYHPGSFGQELPMVHISSLRGSAVEKAYAAALAGAMLTTALANAFGLIGRFRSFRGRTLPRPLTATVLVLLALPPAWLGFSLLVATLYPLMGLMALPILWMFLRYFLL